MEEDKRLNSVHSIEEIEGKPLKKEPNKELLLFSENGLTKYNLFYLSCRK